MKKFLAAAVFVLCTAGASFAWDCTNPLAERVPVPAGTAGTFGDGTGQLFLGTASEGVAGQLYECEVVPPGTTAPAGSIATSQSSSSSNSSSQSNSSSKSNSNSNSNATGGNATAVGQGGAGGSVKNSGNSSNTNVNTAQGGAGGNANQKQTQSQTATGGSSSAVANGNGVGNGNNSNDTTVNYPRQVATAIAPEVFPTVPCFKGFSAGAQGAAFGASFGGGKIDENCASLEAARQAPNRLTRCEIFILNKYAQKAGVTLEQCLQQDISATIITPVVAPTAPPQIVVNVPAINVPAPVIIEQQVPAPALPVAARPLPPPVKQHHVIKPCPANKMSQSVFTDDSFLPFPEPIKPVCE